jgi:hypothetical protein
MQCLISHCGGDDIISEPQRMISRHVAVLDTEALFLSDKIGAARNAGEEPTEKTIDLFNRVVANQRRLLEAIGMSRTPRNLNPSLGEIIEQAGGGAPARATGASSQDGPPKNISQDSSDDC